MSDAPTTTRPPAEGGSRRLILDHAARLLRESPLPLVRIAEECGFSSQSALTTAMRRYLGLTPRRLRNS